MRNPSYLENQTMVDIKDKEDGFTLIELMIVIAIIGILAAIAIPAFLGFHEKSRQTEAKTNLGAIGTTAEAWRAESDTYIATWAQLGWAAAGTPRYDYGYHNVIYAGANALGVNDPETQSAVSTATTFDATAEGNIDGDAGQDCWDYNEARALVNTTNDVAVDTPC